MLKQCSVLLAWALLAACASRARAQASPILLQPPPSPPIPSHPGSIQGTCEDPWVQLVSLCIFHFVLNGIEWTNSDGWSACRAVLDASERGDAITGSCTYTLDATLSASSSLQQVSPWQALQQEPGPASSASFVFPDACCWHGVSCCLSAACGSLDDPITCNCTPGLVVALDLGDNNVKGNVSGFGLFKPDLIALFGLLCSLRSLMLPNNQLDGALPDSVTAFSELWILSLGYNNITGTIPAGFGHLSTLRILELNDNKLTGSVPADLCGPFNSSAAGTLTDLVLANNRLTGVLNLTRCSNLIMLDAANNELTGVISGRGFFPQLHVLLLHNNRIVSRGFDSSLTHSRAVTELNLAGNKLSGTIPVSISSLYFLTSLVLERNEYNGTLPQSLFNNLGALFNLDLSDNKLRGSLPASFGKASSLGRLDLSNNSLTGPLPDSIVDLMSVYNSYLDIRSTFMSCCGSGFTQSPDGRGWYLSVNYSAPRLPQGLVFSRVLQPVRDYSGAGPSSNASKLNCPFIELDTVNPSKAALVRNQSRVNGLLITWFLDPAYTLYEGCVCDRGSELVNDTQLQLVYCVPLPAPGSDLTWVWILVSVLGATLALLLIWLLLFRGSRLFMVQSFVDMRKRLKGAPQGGLVSIVVTDIQGFSDLMKEHPDITTKALLIHNSHIRKAMWSSFGTTIEQEGDSFSIVFHEAQDAVRFCIQTQLLLANQSWPPGLFDVKHESAEASRLKLTAPSWRHRKSTLLRQLYRSFRRSPGSSAEASRQFPGSCAEANRQLSVKSSVGEGPERLGVASSVTQSCSQGVGAEPAAASPVNGLRVRMGIATGHVPYHSALPSSHVMELAKFVSDAASGGQVLLCSSTFQAVRGLARELGCVGLDGLNQNKLNSSKSRWVLFWRPKAQEQEEAVLLHMGLYLYCKPGSAAPLVLSPQLLQLGLNLQAEGLGQGQGQRWRAGAASATAASVRHLSGQPSLSSAQQGVQLYQVLAPSLVGRGRFLGSKLSLQEEWVPLDVPYFSAPGALLSPLSPSDTVPPPLSLPPVTAVPPHLSLPPVTAVFCMVDGGKQYVSRSRRDAQAVHTALVAMMMSVLRQVSGGYFVKGQDGDLRYMLAFTEPKAAVCWCLAVQECTLIMDWPASALRLWPEQQGAGGRLLFRGPRLKMGLCEGIPRSILPECNGRADYLGDGINMAARFMDAAAHGGQVACTAELALRILGRAPVSSTQHAEPSTREAASLGSPSPSPSPSPAPADAMPHTSARMAAAADAAKELQGHSGSSLSPAPGPAPGRASGPCRLGQLGMWRRHEEGHQGGGAGPGVAAVSIGLVSGAEEKEAPDLCGQSPQGPAVAAPDLVPPAVSAAAAPSPSPSPSPHPQATQGTPAPPQPQAPGHCTSEVLALQLGCFRFKGSDEIIHMVHITRASLATRSFPPDPPRGKGARLTEAAGVLAAGQVPRLDIVDEYSGLLEDSILERPSVMPLPSFAARFSSLLSLRWNFGSNLQPYSVANLQRPRSRSRSRSSAGAQAEDTADHDAQDGEIRQMHRDST